MKILETYDDGSRTVLYEVGDRVRLLEVPGHAKWLAKPGELATVVAVARKNRRSSIDFFDIRTDAMVAGNWGVLCVAPWDVEIVEESK